MNSRRIRLLVATRHSPLPGDDGAGAYLFDLLAYLAARNVRIDIAWLHVDGALIRRGWWIVPAEVHTVARVHLPGAIAFGRLRFFPKIWWLPFKARALHRLKLILQFLRVMPRRHASRSTVSHTSRTSGGPAAWSALPSASETDFFRSVAERVPADAALANYCWLTPLFMHAPRARRLVLTHDVAAHRLALACPTQVDDPHPLNPARAEGERALLRRADVVLAITDDDAAVFRARLPSRDILVVPKSCSLPSFRRTEPAAGRCVFVGSANEFNREGLVWLLEHVWPLVWAELPTATLHVYGAVSATVSAPPPGVSLCGRVPDLSEAYAEAMIALVALLRGSGLKIKLVEAAAHARACVSTSVGLQGLAFLRPHVPVADEPASFAREIISLLRNPDAARALGATLQHTVAERLSPENCYAPLHRWLAGPPSPTATVFTVPTAPRFVAPPLATR